MITKEEVLNKLEKYKEEKLNKAIEVDEKGHRDLYTQYNMAWETAWNLHFKIMLSEELEQPKLFEAIVSNTDKFIEALQTETVLLRDDSKAILRAFWVIQPENSVENIINKACVEVEKNINNLNYPQFFSGIYNVIRPNLSPENFNTKESAGIIMMGARRFAFKLIDTLSHVYHEVNLQGPLEYCEGQMQKGAMEYIQNTCEDFYLDHINDLDRSAFSPECLDIIDKADQGRGRCD